MKSPAILLVAPVLRSRAIENDVWRHATLDIRLLLRQILMEKDEIRKPVVTDILDFFRSHSDKDAGKAARARNPRDMPKGMVTPQRFSFLTWEYMLLVGVCAMGTALVLSREEFPRTWARHARR